MVVASTSVLAVPAGASQRMQTTPTTTGPTTTTTTRAGTAAPTTTTTLAPAKPPARPGGTVAWAPASGARSAVGEPLLYLAQTGAAGLAWMPPGLVRPVMVPGTGDPLSSPWGAQIDPASRPLLVASFNGGFQFKDFTGGMISFGQLARSMADGQGTFVAFADGTFNVGLWGRDFTSTANMTFARQNLGMLVDGGAPTAAAASTSPAVWGASVAGVATMRSAVGVDANGGLVWAGGRLSPPDLAAAMIAGGAVRAMQMDINPDWVNFSQYSPDAAGQVRGAGVYGVISTDRYYRPDSRDFVAILIRGTVVPGDSGKVGQVSPPVELRLPRSAR